MNYVSLLILCLLFSSCKNKTPAFNDIDFKALHKEILADAPNGVTAFEQSIGLGACHTYTAKFLCPTKEDAMELIYLWGEMMGQTLSDLDADIHGGSGALDNLEKAAQSFEIQYHRSGVSGFMRMQYYHNARKEVFAEFIFYETR